MDDKTRDFVETFQRFLREVVNEAPVGGSSLTPLGQTVAEFLGADISQIPVITHELAAHRIVDADLALAELGQREPHAAAEHRGEPPVGVTGGQQREHRSLSELLFSPFMKFDIGPIDYISEADGAHSTRRVISFGLHRLSIGGKPVVVLQRSAQPRVGRETATLEVLAGDAATSALFIEEFSRLILELSVLRGKVVSFTGDQYQQSSGG